VNARILAEFEENGADVWYIDGFKERILAGLYDPAAYSQVFDVLDVWFDSGSTHAFVLRDRADGSEDGLADLYLEGTDQHRGWFHSSMLQSCGTKGRAPYRGVLTHGFTLDEKGMKMSKSVGNTVAPEEVIKEYGAAPIEDDDETLLLMNPTDDAATALLAARFVRLGVHQARGFTRSGELDLHEPPVGEG
jgi:isoleucyl-tRNA synthetase